MEQQKKFLSDLVQVQNAFNFIQDYPLNALDSLKKLTSRQRFMAAHLLTDYLDMIADVSAYEENVLKSFSFKERQTVLYTLETQPDPSLVSHLPPALDSAYMKIFNNTKVNFKRFYSRAEAIACHAFNTYQTDKPDPEEIDKRCENLAKLLSEVVNEDVSVNGEETAQKNRPPYIQMPVYEKIRLALSTFDFFERKERLDQLHKELESVKPMRIDSTLEGLQYRMNHKGQKLSDTSEMKAKRLRQLKKERLIRKKLAAENKRIPQNRKRFSLKRILSTLYGRTDHSF